MSEEWARRKLAESSGDLRDTLRSIHGHPYLDYDPSAIEPLSLEGDTLSKRIDHMLTVGLRLAKNIVKLTNGEVVDLEVLNDVHSDFVSLTEWTERLQESAYPIPEGVTR